MTHRQFTLYHDDILLINKKIKQNNSNTMKQ